MKKAERDKAIDKIKGWYTFKGEGWIFLKDGSKIKIVKPKEE